MITRLEYATAIPSGVAGIFAVTFSAVSLTVTLITGDSVTDSAMLSNYGSDVTCTVRRRQTVSDRSQLTDALTDVLTNINLLTTMIKAVKNKNGNPNNDTCQQKTRGS